MSDVFYQGQDKKYYKNKEIYEKTIRDKRLWNQCVNFICEELLNYQQGQVFPALLLKKLKELDFYDREVILKTLNSSKNDLQYQLNIDGKFTSDTSKIFYIFAVLRNKINDINKTYDREKRVLEQKVKIEENVDMNFKTGNLQIVAKDMTSWLDD